MANLIICLNKMYILFLTFKFFPFEIRVNGGCELECRLGILIKIYIYIPSFEINSKLA